MIRRDFIMRQVEELAQVLTRAAFLRTQGENQAALQEIRRALRALEGDNQDPDESSIDRLDAEGWLALCRRHEEITGPLLLVVANLLHEKAAALQVAGRDPEATRARDFALTLRLEAILKSGVPVTGELLNETDVALSELPVDALSAASFERLFAYNEQRGRFATAEDLLFDWLETGDPAAGPAGREFYGRLKQLSREDLEAGGLAVDEISDGLAALERTASRQI